MAVKRVALWARPKSWLEELGRGWEGEGRTKRLSFCTSSPGDDDLDFHEHIADIRHD